MLSSPVQSFGTQIQVLIGAWLLTGFARQAAWVAAQVLFAAMAAISFSLGVVGESSCGCFGTAEISPWLTFGLSVVVNAVLLLSRAVSAQHSSRSFILAGITPVCLGVGIGLFVSSNRMDAWLATLFRTPVYIQSYTTDLGSVGPGMKAEAPVTVVNRSARPVRLIGGSASCSCTTTQGLPVDIPAGGKVEIQITVNVNGSPGRFAHGYQLFTDLAGWPRISGRVTGRVADPAR